MSKVIAFIICCILCWIVPSAYSQQSQPTGAEQTQVVDQPLVAEKSPQVGKHVMANMNASSMILSLLMVLGLIIVCALILKRFNLTQQNSAQIKVIASLSLGAKERILVVQIGEEQLVLGVGPQQISLLKNLETPIESQEYKSSALTTNVLSFLQKNSSSNTQNIKNNHAVGNASVSEASSNETKINNK